MKKFLIALVCTVVTLGASAQGKLTVNAGYPVVTRRESPRYIRVL